MDEVASPKASGGGSLEAVPLMSVPQRGLVPTFAFWNQADPAFRPVRVLSVVWVVACALLSTAVPASLATVVTVVALSLWAIGLGAAERVLRREISRRRSLSDGAEE